MAFCRLAGEASWVDSPDEQRCTLQDGTPFDTQEPLAEGKYFGNSGGSGPGLTADQSGRRQPALPDPDRLVAQLFDQVFLDTDDMLLHQ